MLYSNPDHNQGVGTPSRTACPATVSPPRSRGMGAINDGSELPISPAGQEGWVVSSLLKPGVGIHLLISAARSTGPTLRLQISTDSRWSVGVLNVKHANTWSLEMRGWEGALERV